jgi:hypothetical protein
MRLPHETYAEVLASLQTVQQAAETLGISPRRVQALAASRGVGYRLARSSSSRRTI